MSKFEEENYHIDCLMTLNDFYVIQAALRVLAVNMDYMREHVIKGSDEPSFAEYDIQELSDKIGIYINQLEKVIHVLN